MTFAELIVYFIFGPPVIVYGAAAILFTVGLLLYLAGLGITIGAYRLIGCQPPKWTA